MAFSRITDEDRQGKGNVGQPDTPLLTATEMQEQMDSLANLMIDRFNSFLNELEDKSAALSIGCEPPTGVTSTSNTLYAVMSAVARLATSAGTLAHTHANKAALDSLTTNLISDILSLVTIFSGISSVANTVTSDATAVPTSQAIVNYVSTMNIKPSILTAIYPIGAVYQTTSIDPDTLFGTTGHWTLIAHNTQGVKTYKRIA